MAVCAGVLVAAAAAPPAVAAQPERIVDIDRTTGTPRVVARRGGFLTGRSSSDPHAIALGYVRARRDLFRLGERDLDALTLEREYRSGSGTTHLVWAQRHRGVPALDNDLRANVSRDGRLINVLGSPHPDLARVGSIRPGLSAAQALRAAMRSAGVRGRGVTQVGPEIAPERNARFLGGHEATLVLLAEGERRVRLAWRVLLFADSRHVWDAVHDAGSGELLRRRNLVLSAADAKAFDYYPGAASGGTQGTKVFSEEGDPGDPDDPWLTEQAITERLRGNNAWVYSDENDDIYADGEIFNDPPDQFTFPDAGDEIPPSGSAPLAWSWEQNPFTPANIDPSRSCPAAGCTWDAYDRPGSAFSWRTDDRREQAGTQAFYFVNRFHDHLRDAPGIDFDEASGNFEQVNSGGAPGGGDRVEVQIDDGADTSDPPPDDPSVPEGFPDDDHANNANMLTLPDGGTPRMQLYLWSSFYAGGPGVHDVNSADDATVVYHEYAHGLSNRLVTDGDGFGALWRTQAAAMGEGISDWYALDFLEAEGFQPDTTMPGELKVATYLFPPGIRTQGLDCPIGSDSPDCPGRPDLGAGAGGYTYGDFEVLAGCDPASPRIHRAGEIWSETLWDLRRALIEEHEPTLGKPEAIRRARLLVTQGMRNSPQNPSFLDMRNAILAADQADNGGEDQDLIWGVFTSRGMGPDASTTGSDDTNPVEDPGGPRASVCPSSPPPASPPPAPPPEATAPTSVPAPAPTPLPAAARTSLPRNGLWASRHWTVPVRVRCDRSASRCRGQIKIETAGRVRVRVAGAARTRTRLRKLVLAQRRYSLRPGQARTIRLKIRRAGRKLLRRRSSVKARVIVSAADGRAKPRRRIARTTIRAPKRKSTRR